MSTAHVERAIRASILAQHKLRTRVHCPPTVPRRQGESFTCVAYLDVGTYPVTVTETNSSGHVRYGDTAPLVIIDIAKVQRSIEHSILSQRRLHARVLCPPQVLQKAGLRFACIAVVNGRSYPFEVTETDANGRVTYVGR